jgi:hypothetical protein
MPISVTCQCGQSFRAKDDLAGKRVKCPKCGQPLTIPGGQNPSQSGVQQVSSSASGTLSLDDLMRLDASAPTMPQGMPAQQPGAPAAMPGMPAQFPQAGGGGFVPGAPLFGQPAAKKSSGGNKGLIIALCSLGGFVFLAIVAVVLILVFRGSDNSQANVPSSSSTAPPLTTSVTPGGTTGTPGAGGTMNPMPGGTNLPGKGNTTPGAGNPKSGTTNTTPPASSVPPSEGYDSPDAALTAFLEALDKCDVKTFLSIMRRAMGAAWEAIEKDLEAAARDQRLVDVKTRKPITHEEFWRSRLQAQKAIMSALNADRKPPEMLSDGKAVIRMSVKNPLNPRQTIEDTIHFEKDEKGKWHLTLTERERQLIEVAIATAQGKAPKVAERAGFRAGLAKWYQRPQELAGIRYSDEQKSGIQQPPFAYSWMVDLLPYLGREDLYAKFNFKKFFGDQQNVPLAMEVIPQFLNPADPRKTVSELKYHGFGLTHFVGMSGIEETRQEVAAYLPRNDPKAGVFGYDRIAKPQEIGDGASNTLMIIGVNMPRPWVLGGGSTIRGARTPYFGQTVGSDFGSRGQPGAMAMMADGSARMIPPDIDPAVFRAMCTINGKDKVDMQPYPERPELFGGPANAP